MSGLNEADVEAAAVGWLAGLGWSVAHGSEVNPDAAPAERADYSAVGLAATLREALARLNPELPGEALSNAVRRPTHPEGATLEARNRAFHRMVVDGVAVEYRDDGRIRGAQARVVDFDDPANNDWLAVNQFTVVENKIERRPDVVLFVNGLPLGVIELKNPTDPDATIWTAWQQLQTYKADLPGLFSMNAALIVSDGLEARLGTLTAGREWFKPWRTIGGEEVADKHLPQLQVLLQGVCDRRRLLDLVRDFVVFEDDGSGRLDKKIAGYHQFHAVQAAVDETLRAAALQHAASRPADAGRRPGGQPGDRRICVVWHTQGSGKSLTMAAQPRCASCPRHSRWPYPTRPLCPSATTWPSSSPWPRRCPSPLRTVAAVFHGGLPAQGSNRPHGVASSFPVLAAETPAGAGVSPRDASRGGRYGQGEVDRGRHTGPERARVRCDRRQLRAGSRDRTHSRRARRVGGACRPESGQGSRGHRPHPGQGAARRPAPPAA